MLLWNRLDVSPEEREHVIVRTYKTCGKTVLDIVSSFHLKINSLKNLTFIKFAFYFS